MWRLVPFSFLCYVVAYLDRVNVGFAKLQMLNDLKFSEAAYGLGAGIFGIAAFAVLNGQTQGILDAINRGTVETLNLAVAGRPQAGGGQHG